jgi:hypothetical protein
MNNFESDFCQRPGMKEIMVGADRVKGNFGGDFIVNGCGKCIIMIEVGSRK